MSKRRIMRWRKDDHEHNLLKAVRDFVLARGGDILVIGGIEIQDWQDGMGKYRVAVKCLGRAPARNVNGDSTKPSPTQSGLPPARARLVRRGAKVSGSAK